VYHFNPQDFALRRPRAGDYRTILYRAVGEKEAVLRSPVILILTAIYWRNSWKYQARAFRHFFWDSGTITANLLATATSANLERSILLGFVDDTVNSLLGLDVEHESSIVLLPIGRNGQAAKATIEAPTLAPIAHKPQPLSEKERAYPDILKIHSVSALRTIDEVKTWNSTPPIRTEVMELGGLKPLDLSRSHVETPLAKTIMRRGSTRQFSREPIPYSLLSTILHASTVAIQADFLQPNGTSLIEVYLIVNAVDEILQGSYYYDKAKDALEVLKLGNFRDAAGYLCLEQVLGEDCSAAIFLMTNLNAVLRAYGNRGYRAAQLEAGIILGRLYLCAYGLKIGASGITFYDDATTAFFSPHAASMSNMVSAVLGVPAKRKNTLQP
jgi:SagB-type dehydrogenase family enzyme